MGLKLTPGDLDNLRYGLGDLSRARRDHGIEVGSYGNAEVTIADQVLKISWDDEAKHYIVDDWER